jgi:ATP-dependent RNA helicase DeaD
MDNFQSLGLPQTLLQALTFMQFNTPTPIQAQTIPIALKGQDVLGSAQTGTGKTAAYGIPLVSHILNNTKSMALVLAPTRELAVQVEGILRQLLGKGSPIRTALIIGGESMFKQLSQLKTNPRIIVGTPGRINDHLDRGTLRLNQANFIVFDETDRMLDMGFLVQLQEIVKYLPEKRQTLMFSATMAPSIVKVAQSYLTNPQRISIGSTTAPRDHITQETLKTSDADKYGHLLTQLDQEPAGSFIVFVKTKWGTEKLATRLRHDGHSADAIHGDLRQRNRDQVIRSFRASKNRILVATDIAARGLDIPHIECVVNYDLPQCPEDYIHRIGRTGRGETRDPNMKARAISFITSQDTQKWRNICKLLDPDAKQEPERRDYARKSSGKKPFARGPRPAEGFRSPREDKPFFKGKPRTGEGFRSSSEGKPFFKDKPRTGEGFRPSGDKPFFKDKPRTGEGFRPAGDKPYFRDKPRTGEGFRSSTGDRPRTGEGFRPAGDKPYFRDKPRTGEGFRSSTGERPSFKGKPRSGEGFKASGGQKPFFKGPRKSGPPNRSPRSNVR